MPRTLAVFAHFDPGGAVAPHVERYVAALGAAVDRLVVVSTAELDDAGRAALRAHGELVERENVGYDFYSWKTGLDHVGDWDGFERVLICNDSVVGPMRPLAEILGPRAPGHADFWGMTSSHEISPHVQSWFVVFEQPVIASGLLHGFWRAMTPVSDRYVVIRRYEVGLSRLLLAGGLRMGSYLRLPPWAAARAEVRHRSALLQVPRASGAARRRAGSLREELAAPFRNPRWNPTYVTWDAVFTGRLPFVKLEVLRDDPYEIGRERMLERLEQAYPREMDGVREYLERTREEFRRLRGMNPMDPLRGLRSPSRSTGLPAGPGGPRHGPGDVSGGDADEHGDHHERAHVTHHHPDRGTPDRGTVEGLGTRA